MVKFKDFKEKPLPGDITKKKEFARHKKQHIKDELMTAAIKNGVVIPQYYQRFVRDYMSQHTPYDVLLVMHSTGSGKTITSLLIAMEVVKHIRRAYSLYKPIGIQKVFILGFSANTYVTTLLTRPYFGFVTQEEVNNLYSGNYEHFRNQFALLKRRLKLMKYGGAFRFIGYKKLANNVFKDPSKVSSDKLDESNINTEFVSEFENSVIICDEIHNTYNSVDTNTYGEAIKYIVNNIKSTKILYLSWTPITNNAVEIFDLLKLLKINIPKQPITHKVLGEIRSKIRGKVSYLYDQSDGYPDLEYVGTKLKNIEPYRFSLIPPSKKHEKLINDLKNKGECPIYINDMCFPIPGDKPNSIDVGITKTDVRKVKALSPEDQKKLGIKFKSISGDSDFNDVPYGDFIGKLDVYSTKYKYMINLILSIMRNPKRNGKMLIYHQNVGMSGIVFIGEILKYYNFVEIDNDVPSNAISSKGKKLTPKDSAAKYALIHSGQKKDTIAKYLKLFSDVSNPTGDKLKIIVGGNIIKESIDMKGINHIIIVHRPDNYKILDQIIGRGVRKSSHEYVDNKTVQVHILCNTKTREYDYYISKFKDLQVIRSLENVIIDSAIDKSINQSGNKQYSYTLPKSIDKSTFNLYNKSDEVKEAIILIKRLFLIEPIWKYDDLWKAARDPSKSHVLKNKEFKTFTIGLEESSFLLALDYLLHDNDMSTKPYRKFDIFSVSKKIVIDDHVYVIMAFGEYYRLMPFTPDHSNSLLARDNVTVDVVHMPVKLRPINIEKVVEHRKKTFNYDVIKVAANKVWGSKPIEQWVEDDFINRYSIKVYETLIENSIEYIYDLWTQSINKSKYHDLFSKVIYYFSTSFNVIIFAENAGALKHLYTKYTTSPVKLQPKFVKKCSSCSPIDTSSKKVFDRSLNIALSKRSTKAPSNMLPVGYNLHSVAKFYLHEDKPNWFESHKFKHMIKTKENDIVVGFFRRQNSEFKFKLRTPIHKQRKTKDQRMQESGTSCENVPKEALVNYMNLLKIPMPKEYTSKQLCEILKLKLIELEKTKPEKYVYQFFEDSSGKVYR